MTATQLLTLINEHYPDDLVLQAWRKFRRGGVKTTHDVGDGLAVFVVREIVDTYEGRKVGETATETNRRQLETAAAAMETAVRELQAIQTGLEAML